MAAEFIVEAEGPENLFCVFEDDGKTGYLYVYEPDGRGVMHHLHVYDHAEDHIVTKSDVEIVWSVDFKKCGVIIKGEMRGVMEVASGNSTVIESDNASSKASQSDWLNGFDTHLNRYRFIRARQQFWKQELKYTNPEVQVLPESDILPDTKFIVCKSGPEGIFAVFEDDGTTGYLYLYDSDQNTICRRLQIYDIAPTLNVTAEDVEVVWSEDSQKCGVLIWGRMRGIIDRIANQEGRVKLENHKTPGIGDKQWLKGFEYLGQSPN